MADADENLPPEASPEAGPQELGAPMRRRKSRAWAAGVAVLAVAAAIGWQYRTNMVDRLVSGQLSSLGLPGSYQIAEVGAGRQVLTHVVLGDPAHPDFTAERVETRVGLSGWAPGIQSVTLVKPRLYGRWRNGRLSFGSLDRVIYGPSAAPFHLPNLELVVVDGRGGLETPAGGVGVSLAGAGALRGGFSGVLAAAMPGLRMGDCTVQGAAFHGELRTRAERPKLTGPLRLERVDCGKSGLVLAKARLGIAAEATPALDGGMAVLDLATGAAALGGLKAQGLSGKVTAQIQRGQVTAGYQLAARAASGGGVVARTLAVEGRLRGADMGKLTADGTLSGEGIAPAGSLNAQFTEWGKSAEGTLAAPLLAQLAEALRREGAHSRLSGQYVAHRSGSRLTLVVPEAHVIGSSGQRVANLSRVMANVDPGRAMRLTGNLSTGGQGLPQLQARLEPAGAGGQVLRLAMAEYRAGKARASVPDLRLVSQAGGALGFAGRVVLSGAVPGGDAGNLVVPVDGRWSAGDGLAVWPKCAKLGFDWLNFGSTELAKGTVSLCPAGQPVLTIRGGSSRLGAVIPGLDVTGHMGVEPLHITSGAVRIGLAAGNRGAANGQFSAKDLAAVLGGGESAPTRMAFDAVDGRIGSTFAGSFAGGEVALAAVPLDITKGLGQWRYGADGLVLGEAGLTLRDRDTPARFQPLIARGANLRLAGGVITTDAHLREPQSDREVAAVTIRHELNTGRGHADLAVAGISFDNRLQPDTLTPLALGVIANASGTVKGHGRIDWQPGQNGGKVTSFGRFSTDGLDFAAAVGPLKGVSGTVVFTDLLGLVTAPDQHLFIGAINPGIEVDNGDLTYALLPGHVLAVKGATWPFLDGRMELLPTRMQLGVAEVRRYEIRVAGMNAAKFLQHMDLGNLSATGTFDGSLPMIFDENGGRIEGGVLASRPPGGTVSYLGELTYKDLSPMANYAFKALRALKYRQMRIGMDGAIAGELVTRVTMQGVSQGVGATRNFITNQLAALPIQFNVNLRGPFYQLITSFKSMYDPSYVKDPRSLGLIGADGRALPLVPVPAPPPAIQPPAREQLP